MSPRLYHEYNAANTRIMDEALNFARVILGPQ